MGALLQKLGEGLERWGGQASPLVQAASTPLSLPLGCEAGAGDPGLPGCLGGVSITCKGGGPSRNVLSP